MTDNTDNKQAPAHDCAEIIAREMFAVEREARNNSDCPDWDNLRPQFRRAYVAAVKALPGILLAHAGNDLKDFLTVKIGNSSPWRSLLGYLSSAAVGAAVLWATSFFVSCAPVTPGQVRQWDEAHDIMHRVTRTDCTLCSPTVIPAK